MIQKSVDEIMLYHLVFERFLRILIDGTNIAITNTEITSITLNSFKNRISKRQQYYTIFNDSVMRCLDELRIQKTESQNTEEFLKLTAQKYGKIKYAMFWISKFFYLEKKGDQFICYTKGFEVVKKRLLTNGRFILNMKKSLFAEIQNSRIEKKENILIRPIIELIHSLCSKSISLTRNEYDNQLKVSILEQDTKLYQELFYEEFCKQACEYYENIPKNNVNSYVNFCFEALKYEQQFLFSNLYKIRRSTLDIFEMSLIVKSSEFIRMSETGFLNMLRNKEDIMPVYKLFRRLEYKSIKKQKKKKQKIEQGEQKEQIHQTMQQLLNTYRLYLDEAIANPLTIKNIQTPDNRFLQEKSYMLSMQPVSLQILVTQLNACFQNSAEIQNLIFLLNWFKDKDVFFEKYKNAIAMKIIQGKDIEQVEKGIRMEYGNTAGINMIHEAQRWQSISKQFISKTNTVCHMKTLKIALWPNYPLLKNELCEPFITLKDEMEHHFRKYYPSSFLKITNLGTVILGLPPNQFVVTQEQAIFMLGFNNNVRIQKSSFKFYDPSSIKSLLHSKLVLEDQTTYKLNPTWKQKRIRINLIAKEKQKPKEETIIDIPSRIAVLQGVLVKVMKSRNILEFQQLIAQTKKLVKHFQPEPKLIKAVIQGLIQKGYFSRDEKNPKFLLYIP